MTDYSYGVGDQILIPNASNGYDSVALLNLLGYNLTNGEGYGLAPLHFNTQRAPYQDGATPVSLRFDGRVLQIAVNERFCNLSQLYDRHWAIVDQLRPNRSFGSGPARPAIYRKWLPGGVTDYGTDLTTYAGKDIVYSPTAKFIERGLRVGSALRLTSGADVGTYTVTDAANDYQIRISANLSADATNVGWQFTRTPSYRDLFVLLEAGPQLAMTTDNRVNPHGFQDVLRFIAHDPFWYAPPQVQLWDLPIAFGDLIFDGFGAWVGNTPGAGRWLFGSGTVGSPIDTVYWGHRTAGVRITITGPATNPVIINTTTGVTIVLTYSVSAGETVVIDTSALTCTNNFGQDLYRFLSGDLVNFGLNPDTLSRINTLVVGAGGGVVGSTSIAMTWRNVHLAV